MFRRNELDTISVEDLYFWMQGGYIKEEDIKNFGDLARVATYVIKRGSYHRKNLCRALVILSSYAPVYYRDVAWALIQMVPLSHLLYIPDVIKKPSKEVKNRLRHAIVTKIANSEEDEIIKTFFISPSRFRKLFSFLKLPRDSIDGAPINNKKYLLASKLSSMKFNEALEYLNLTIKDIVERFNIPFHIVMHHIKEPSEAKNVAEIISPKDFLRHGRWFKYILGEEQYNKILSEKVRLIKNPFEFLMISNHLLETGVITEEIVKEFENKARMAMKELIKKSDVRNIALLIDISGSMHVAIALAKALLQPFKMLSLNITSVVVFNDIARRISIEEIDALSAGGSTSISAGLEVLYKSFKNSKVPDIILLISDLCHNTGPHPQYIIDTYYRRMEYKPPIVAIVVGYSCNLELDYPFAIIKVKEFHRRQIYYIISEIFNAISNIREEGVISSSRSLAQLILEIELPKRPEESLKKGYLKNLLGGNK